MPKSCTSSLIVTPHCAGVDEAGRGPLAGPVVAAAVVLNSHPPGLNDSKKLSEAARDRLVPEIKAASTAWSVAFADHEEIDQFNILQASLRAMQRAVAELSVKPHKVWVDGNRLTQFKHGGSCLEASSVIGGDGRYAAIAAASILAKVHRDAFMRKMDERYPAYGFARHKGYPTVAHRQSLEEFGPCAIHRASFAPVRKVLARLNRA